jgi:hypothetical protein
LLGVITGASNRSAPVVQNQLQSVFARLNPIFVGGIKRTDERQPSRHQKQSLRLFLPGVALADRLR